MRQEPIYRFEDLADDGSQYLVKVEVVDIDTVHITQHPSGEMCITPAPASTPEPVDTGAGKYRLEPEGDLYRLYALRTIARSISPGSRGGLVSGSHNLSRYGECWIGQDAKVRDGFQVMGNAFVFGESDLCGAGVAENQATVENVTTVAHRGIFSIGGQSCLRNVTVDVGTGAELLIYGDSGLTDSNVTVSPYARMAFNGCRVADGDIRNQYEVLTTWHPSYGWLTAFRHRSGRLRFKIGCQARDTAEGMRELAAGHGEPPQHLQMLDLFLAMVEVAQAHWKDAPAPKSDLPTFEAAGAVVDEVEASAPGVVSFADLARRARDVTEMPRLRSATELPDA
jgi:hypothetical protein